MSDRQSGPLFHLGVIAANTGEIERLSSKVEELVEQNAALRAEMAEREEAAYRHGLGDRSAVYDQNHVLAATIAALTDRHHTSNLRGRG